MAKEKRLKDKAGRIFLTSKRLQGRKGFTEVEIDADGGEEFETVSDSKAEKATKAKETKAEKAAATKEAKAAAKAAADEGWEE